MKKAKIDIRLTSGPELGQFESCHMHVVVKGDPLSLRKMFAATLHQHPHLLHLLVDAVVLMDSVQEVHKTGSDQ